MDFPIIVFPGENRAHSTTFFPPVQAKSKGNSAGEKCTNNPDSQEGAIFFPRRRCLPFQKANGDSLCYLGVSTKNDSPQSRKENLHDPTYHIHHTAGQHITRSMRAHIETVYNRNLRLPKKDRSSPTDPAPHQDHPDCHHHDRQRRLVPRLQGHRSPVPPP